MNPNPSASDLFQHFSGSLKINLTLVEGVDQNRRMQEGNIQQKKKMTTNYRKKLAGFFCCMIEPMEKQLETKETNERKKAFGAPETHKR